ncbi:hypothetical protein [Skermania piniformis]|uniref:Uncharacterized protein n=1 Tax=Skermania pinensis TaxID=39122 RepID=A0ABX8SBS3_9ACTN|nr:hypothetical protein [Skermania piniformis]QXQ15318.1 hypothetical protein KV203_08410 [Skermania piniformis]
MTESAERLSLVLLADVSFDAAADQARQTRQAADERRQNQERAAAEQRQNDLRAAGRRRTRNDWPALQLLGAAAVTVLVPYLVGHFLMRRTPLLADDPAVFEPRVRGLLDHFVPDYLGGLLALTVPVALFLVVRPWAYRQRTAVIGAVLLAASLFVLLPMASERWKAAEAASAVKLRETSFPYADNYFNCASWTLGAENGRHQSELWQVHLGQSLGTPGTACNRVDVYRGWQFVGKFELDGEEGFTEAVTVTTPDWTEAYHATSSGDIYSTAADGRRVPLNPITTTIALGTTAGRDLNFTLDGAATGGFWF